MPCAAQELAHQARRLVPPQRVLLTVDEPAPTVERYFRWAGLSSTTEDRRAYRQMLFTTPGLEEHVSGVILSDEVIRQRVTKGPSFVELLTERRITPGIRVDLGQVLAAESLSASVVARSYEKIQRRRDLPWQLSFSLGADTMASTLRARARHDRDEHAAQEVLRSWTARLASGDRGSGGRRQPSPTQLGECAV